MKAKIFLPTNDFGRALDVADKFNIASAARKGVRAQRVLSEALDFMSAVLPGIGSGHTVEAGSHHGMDPFLDVVLGRDIARRKDKTAYLAGHAAVGVSKTDAVTLKSVRDTFKLSSDDKAAVLAVRVYQRALDHLWRGNSIIMSDAECRDVPLDVSRFKERACKAYIV